jgi:hypothetical protein
MHETRDACSPGWVAVCLTIVGAVVGPLTGLAWVFSLREAEWFFFWLVLLPIPMSGGFFLGVFAGYWLGGILDKSIGKLKR